VQSRNETQSDRIHRLSCPSGGARGEGEDRHERAPATAREPSGARTLDTSFYTFKHSLLLS
jgi:hypothetical protein